MSNGKVSIEPPPAVVLINPAASPVPISARIMYHSIGKFSVFKFRVQRKEKPREN
jgi:hypothetical protein